MNKKLYRSNKDSKIAGVCGGLAEYLDVDVSIVRIVTLLLILGYGAGLIVYIIAALIIPVDPN